MLGQAPLKPRQPQKGPPPLSACRNGRTQTPSTLLEAHLDSSIILPTSTQFFDTRFHTCRVCRLPTPNSQLSTPVRQSYSNPPPPSNTTHRDHAADSIFVACEATCFQEDSSSEAPSEPTSFKYFLVPGDSPTSSVTYPSIDRSLHL